jgi:CubicO group peptidase (beta-lactamase class C family)
MPRVRRYALVLAGALLLAPGRAATSQPAVSQPSVRDTIDRVVEAEMARQHIPGVAIAVVHGGRVVKAAGYGLADVERRVPVTPETVFKIGSVSKQFLATGVMLLAQDGRLSVDDPIARFYPDAPETWRGITLRHFLTHTSGVIREGPAFAPALVQPDSVVVRSAFGAPLVFPTGSRFQYCNVCYFALADVIARVSGRPWDAFLAERVFAPNGMTATHTTAAPDTGARFARGFAWRDGAFVAAPQFTAVRPSGAFVSTVLDLARWDAALHAERPLARATRDAMLAPARLTDGATSGYGLGWYLDSLDGRRRAHHGGSLPGFRAHMSRLVDDSVSVIVLTNAEGANAAGIGALVTRAYLAAPRAQR